MKAKTPTDVVHITLPTGGIACGASKAGAKTVLASDSKAATCATCLEAIQKLVPGFKPFGAPDQK